MYLVTTSAKIASLNPSTVDNVFNKLEELFEGGDASRLHDHLKWAMLNLMRVPDISEDWIRDFLLVNHELIALLYACEELYKQGTKKPEKNCAN